MVTPSFVIVGAPHFLSMTTLRPLGPSVTLTALASASTPRSSDLRAESSNSSCLAMVFLWLGLLCGSWESGHLRCLPGQNETHPGETPAGLTGVRSRHTAGSADDGEDVAGREDQELLAAVLDLGAAVLAVDDLVADLDVERDALGAGVVEAAGADSEDLALLGLLLGRVRDDEAGCSGLLGLEGLDDDAVFERLDGNRHGGDLPFGTVGN